MPRNVRPAYMTLSADGVASTHGTGPRHAGGTLSATLTLRTAEATVSDPIHIGAGWYDGRAELRIPAGMSVDVERLASGATAVTIRQGGAS